MKHFLALTLISFLLFSCGTEQNKTAEQSFSDSITPLADNKRLTFEKRYNDSILVKGFFSAGEEDWKTDLEFYIHDKLIYTTESLLEYQFNDYPFPVVIKQDSALCLLIERDDRPLSNKMDVFKIEENKIDTIFSIPLFEQKGKDMDKDGVLEYTGYLESIEGRYPDKRAYNPVFVYELSNIHLRFDSSATEQLNKKIYGSFHGYKVDESIQINTNKINDN
ncbi:MAG: hypothetical protein K0R51_2748 [Cytophagaceae bacterium]|jgi:hypothetical protein|nr:hypothetical protein [Cytophagaceae bacterium]